MKRIDDAVRRILRVKFRAGLFEHPYAPVDPAQAEAQMLQPDAVAAARSAASRSMVLLQNTGGILPLDPTRTTAVIGPLATERARHARPVVGRRPDEDAVTVFDGIAEQSPGATYAQGCALSNTEPPHDDPEGCGTDAGFAEAVAVAQAADQVVLALGETREMSGEAASRSTLDLPGRQEELIRAIKATGKPFVVVLFNGRPLALEEVVADAPAVLEAWFPGVQAGPAVADVLFGEVNPGGKLPVTFPSRLGPGADLLQPRADRPAVQPGVEVQLALPGHPELRAAVRVRVRAELHDVRGVRPAAELHERAAQGSREGLGGGHQHRPRAGDEVVQLYLHDPVASISQPVRRLRGFERVTLEPGASQTVTFTLDKSDFGFYDNRGRFVVEKGQIDVFAGSSSNASLTASFTVR